MMPGPPPTDAGRPGDLIASPSQIDVEGWGPIAGKCSSQ